jgi:hypothetical protein
MIDPLKHPAGLSTAPSQEVIQQRSGVDRYLPRDTAASGGAIHSADDEGMTSLTGHLDDHRLRPLTCMFAPRQDSNLQPMD